MNTNNTQTLFMKFSHLYRMKKAPLESSKMGLGFQCEDGWYKILYDMSKRIQKISKDDDYAAAITNVSVAADGTLKVEVENPSPRVDLIVTGAQEQSRLTCEYCSYSPALVRTTGSHTKDHVTCGRCVRRLESITKPNRSKRRKKPLRPPDTIVVKR